jgi:hypothetical protein
MKFQKYNNAELLFLNESASLFEEDDKNENIDIDEDESIFNYYYNKH